MTDAIEQRRSRPPCWFVTAPRGVLQLVVGCSAAGVRTTPKPIDAVVSRPHMTPPYATGGVRITRAKRCPNRTWATRLFCHNFQAPPAMLPTGSRSQNAPKPHFGRASFLANLRSLGVTNPPMVLPINGCDTKAVFRSCPGKRRTPYRPGNLSENCGCIYVRDKCGFPHFHSLLTQTLP
jgi:hypothetical protein